MRIGRCSNGDSHEWDMQAKFKLWLENLELFDYNNYKFEKINISFIDELTVNEVGRRADFIVWRPGNGLINIEAKTHATSILIQQLNDHAKYCDYSFAFIANYTMTPKWFKKQLCEKGYGLIVYDYKTGYIMEALEAHKNHGIDKKLHEAVRQRMQSEIIKRKRDNTANQENENQANLF